MKTNLLFSLSILYFLGACSSPLTEEYHHWNITFRIKGTVTDASNNFPISSATATLMYDRRPLLPCAHTDIKGQYTMEVVQLWSDYRAETFLSLSFDAKGYYSRKIEEVRVIEEWQTIDIKLEPLPKSGGLQ